MTSRYLIYGLADPRDGQLRYVGKSSNGPYRGHQHSCPSDLRKNGDTYKAHWIRSVLSSGLRPDVVVLEEFSSALELSSAEQFWIAYLRYIGCSLTNASSGGDGGLAGYRHKASTKAKIAKAVTGRKWSPEYRAVFSKCKGGRPFADQNGAVYQTHSEAALKLGLNRRSVGKVLNGEISHTGGYSFRYTE